MAVDHSGSSAVVWESWLKQRGLSHPRTVDRSPNSSILSKHQSHLAVIIQDMLSQQSKRNFSSQCWTEVFINELNVRFWRWMDNLPASCRWDRWGSNLDPVYPDVAALQYVSLPVESSQKLMTKQHAISHRYNLSPLPIPLISPWIRKSAISSTC